MKEKTTYNDYLDSNIYSWKQPMKTYFTLDDVTNKYDLEDIVEHIGIDKLERYIRQQKVEKLKKLSE